MRLVHSTSGIDLVLNEMTPSIVTIESIERFAELINELACQYQGGDGNFVLSEKEKQLSLPKYSALIMNPFSVSCNEKKIVTKLYSELGEEASGILAEQTAQVNAVLVDYLDRLTSRVHYPLQFDFELDISGLLKLFDVKINEIDTDLLSRLLSYMKLTHRVLGTRLFILVGIKNYFTDSQLTDIYHECINEKVLFLDFESRYIDKLEGEHHTLIDKDWCFIQL